RTASRKPRPSVQASSGSPRTATARHPLVLATSPGPCREVVGSGPRGGRVGEARVPPRSPLVVEGHTPPESRVRQGQRDPARSTGAGCRIGIPARSQQLALASWGSRRGPESSRRPPAAPDASTQRSRRRSYSATRGDVAECDATDRAAPPNAPASGGGRAKAASDGGLWVRG